MTLDEILKEIDEEPKLTLPLLRKKYKGKKVDLSKLPEYECSFSKDTLQMDWEFTYLAKWSGDEFEYDATVTLNEDLTIKQIGALHCRRYTGSDATLEGYRGKPADGQERNPLYLPPLSPGRTDNGRNRRLCGLAA